MRFNTSDPDLATIFSRISREMIDLQPNFQRGEVWSTPKKQRLIDSILRRWHVPPIHLVAKGGGRFDVLDGQQRLTAIRDFMQGDFPVDGTIDPPRDELRSLHGLRFHRLPEHVREEFETFAIRVFELHDYTPEEPHELFFRLNQPTNLTEAEKRNAFIGGPRNQIRELVEWAKGSGMTPDRIGFSDSRMAYDDLFARFILTLEQQSLTEKVTAQRITNRYRLKEEFSEELMRRARASIGFVLSLRALDQTGEGIKPNKATVHTWLCMAAELYRHSLLSEHGESLGKTIAWIERGRQARGALNDPQLSAPLSVFHDRATARVADASSVVLRDLCAWMAFVAREPNAEADLFRLAQGAWHELSDPNTERSLSAYAQSVGWGALGWI